MISANTLAVFALASFVIIIIPGPSVLFIVGRALHVGRKGALVTMLGNQGGEVVHVILVAFGVGALIMASATAFAVLKYAGAAYLLYLGIQAIRHRRDGLDVADDAEDVSSKSNGALAWEGFMVGLLNPKTMVFIAAVLPQFVDPMRGPGWAQILILGAVFTLIAIVSDGGYALVAGSAREWFAHSPKRIERMRATGGAMIVGLGVALATARRVT